MENSMIEVMLKIVILVLQAVVFAKKWKGKSYVEVKWICLLLHTLSFLVSPSWQRDYNMWVSWLEAAAGAPSVWSAILQSYRIKIKVNILL